MFSFRRNNNAGQQNLLFSGAKAVFTAFGKVWGADSKSVLIFSVTRKVLKLWNYIYYKYLYF